MVNATQILFCFVFVFRIGEELFRLCEGMVKQRTCHTNYAPSLAVLKFQHDTFRFIIIFVLKSKNCPKINEKLTERCMRSWATRGQNSRTTLSTTSSMQCRAFMWRQVCLFVCLFVCLKYGFAFWLCFCFAMEVYCYFLADNAVSMVKRFLSGLAKWASKQPTYKVEFPQTMK